MVKAIVFFLSLLAGFTASWAAAGDWVTVKWVFDGDTVKLENGRRVRYNGINAPEVSHKNKAGEPFGIEAERFNRQLVSGKRIRIDFDSRRHDQYGRLLAYVFLKGGTFVNALLLEKGLAYFLPTKQNQRYDALFLKNQGLAIAGRRGIWRLVEKKDARCPETYIGNRGSRRFHKKDCRFGRKIGKKKRVVFNSLMDAFCNGYAPCKKCMDGGWY